MRWRVPTALALSESPKSRSARRGYRGRYSLQKSPMSTQSGVRARKRLPKQRSPKRRSEYLEDLEEYNQWSNAIETYSHHSSSLSQISPGQELLKPFPSAEAYNQSTSHHAQNNASSLTEFLRDEVSLLERFTNPEHSTEGDVSRRMLLAASLHSSRHCGEELWLHLTAYLTGRPMDRRHIYNSLAGHDKHLAKMRREKALVLNEIRELGLDAFQLPSPSSSFSVPAFANNPIELVYSPCYSEHIWQCIRKVESLLERLEAFVLLYPSMKAARRGGGEEVWDSGLELRIDNLYMWYNSVKDLLGRINEAGNYLGLIEGSASKYSTSQSSKTPFSSPSSPLTSTNQLTPYSPIGSLEGHNTTSCWKYELWPDNFFSARAIAERLSRSTSSSSPNHVQEMSGYAGNNGNGSSNENVENFDAKIDKNNHPPHMQLSMVDMCSDTFTEIYHKVVGKSLRLRGMIEVLKRLEAICHRSLDKAALALLAPRQYSQIAGSNEVAKFLSTLRKKYEWRNDAVGVNSATFLEMNLPTFYPHFLFLTRMPLDLVHQWLKMRAERVVSPEWDLLTLNTLIEDCHDCLQTAIDVKSRFINMVELTTPRAGEQLCYLESFDEKLEKIFQNYLSYVRCWTQTATSKHCSDLDWSEKVIDILIDEWHKAKGWSVSVNRGEISTAQRFCEIASDVLRCMALAYMDEKFDLVDSKLVEVRDEEDYILIDDGESLKHSSIYVLCRNFKEMIREMKGRLLKSLSFVRLFCSDLEICARYAWNDSAQENHDGGDKDAFLNQLINRLTRRGHIAVKFSNDFECQFFVLCSPEIVTDFEYIDSLLNATYRSTHRYEEESLHRQSSRSEGGYLVLIPDGVSSRRRMEDLSNRMVSMKLSFAAKCTIAQYITADGIFVISESRDALDQSRRRFESAAGDLLIPLNRLTLIDDFCSCNDELFSLISSLKSLAFKTIHETWTHARGLGHFILNGRKIGDLKSTEGDCLRATLFQAWEAIFDCYKHARVKELSEIVSLQGHQQFYSESLEILKEWQDFLAETMSDRAAPVALKWAAMPLRCFKEMPSRLFQESQMLSGTKKEALSEELHRCAALLRTLEVGTTKEQAPEDDPMLHLSHSTSAPSPGCCSPQSPPDYLGVGVASLSLENLLARKKKTSVVERINSRLQELEQKRDEMLRETRRVGRVVETRHTKDFNTYFLPSHKMRVPFEWQRLENKELGAGGFGKVFLVMNLKDKCLMAVKQVKVQRENNHALRALVDEVDILRQLDHPNLVRYYGVEVHKEEILIFMEYCSEGTLQRVCREGLDEGCVRRYTHYLLHALVYLHDHHIVHRDVKPENIFLAQKDVLKLGDFGCSLRLKESSTQIGELIHHVGTVRYMAPEIQTNGGLIDDGLRKQKQVDKAVRVDSLRHSSDEGECLYIGYGRAVDIWSLGCVVLEMLTGKKPYHDMNHEFQIIYFIGLGNAPRIPDNIRKCQMTHTFLQAVFQIEPKERPTARELLQHPFANIMLREPDRDSLDN